MTSYVTPKKNSAFILYFGLESFGTSGAFQSVPTLAAGDFKVSIDGAALANLATLPTNTPGGVMVKASLSGAEMNGDNITIVCIDQTSPKEWCDTIINVQTSARQIDDLAYPATSGRSMVVDASGLVDANVVKVGPTGSGTAQTAGDLATMITAVDDFVDTEVAAIKTQTDKLTFTVANQLDVNVLDWKSATAPAMTGDAFARLGAPAGASVSADIATVAGYVDTEVGTLQTTATAIKNKTDNLPAAPAAVGDIPTANANADALLDRADAIETGWTLRKVLRIMSAAINGKVSGGGTTTNTFRNITDSKDRVTSTVDANGNRTAVTNDGA